MNGKTRARPDEHRNLRRPVPDRAAHARPDGDHPRRVADRRKFDLGQFFGVWGVRLTPDCVGGYCRQVTPWTVYVNGQGYTGDPAALVLKSHQEIAIVIGTPPTKIPTSYKFPPNT